MRVKHGGDDNNNQKRDPVSKAQNFKTFGMLIRFLHSLFQVEEPSTTECLKDSNHKQKVSTEIVINDIKEDEAPIAAEW